MPILTRNGAELPTLKVYINVDFRAPPESRSSRVATGVEGKSTSQVQDMLFEKYGINWNNLSTVEKRGTAIIKNEEDKWIIDEEMPILTGENRSYVESRIVFGDDKV